MKNMTTLFDLKTITKRTRTRTCACTLSALVMLSAVPATANAAANLSGAEPAILTSGTADVVIERTQLRDSDAPQNIRDVIVAQANPTNAEKRVVIKHISTSSEASGGFEAMMSEALSGISGTGLSISTAKSIKNAPYRAEVISEMSVATFPI